MPSARRHASAIGPTQRVRIDSRRRWFPDVREIMRYRELVVLLGRRDITVKYRQTIFGTAWIFAGPLVSAGLFTFVFGRIAELPSGGTSYFVFSYVGLLAWNVFLNVLNGASNSLTANAALITKIYFPRLVIPISTVASVLVTTVISIGVAFVMLLIEGIGLTWQILLLPMWLGLALMLALGVAILLSAVSVQYRDINYVTPLLTQLLLFLSPVAYSVAAVPENLQDLYLLNPLATIIEGTRWSVLGGDYLPPAWALAYMVLWCVGSFVVGLMVFARREWIFADVV